MEAAAEVEIPVTVAKAIPPPLAERGFGCSTEVVPQFCEEEDESRLLDGLHPMDAGPYRVSALSCNRGLASRFT